MKKLRLSILGLVLYLVGLFCLELIGWKDPALANSAWLNFWLSIFAVVLVIAIPDISRMRPQIWVAIFSVLFLVSRFGLQWYDPSLPVLGGVNTYITLSQFLLLMLAIGMAIQVSISLNEIQEIVQDILLGNGPHQSQLLEKAAADIEREFLRSKRHHFPLTVIAIEPDPQSMNINLTRTMREIQQSMMARFILSRLVHITSQLVRRTDLIINQSTDTNNFIVFSPDITTDQAERLAGRIITSIEKQTGVTVHCGIATYPDEGLNYEDLVRIAQDRLKPDNSHLAEELDALLKGDNK